MPAKPRKNGKNTGSAPPKETRFKPGNPGRPKGALNKTTLAAQELLDGEAEALTRACIDKAKEGDTTALRLCLERIVPARKTRPITLDLPPIETAQDIVTAYSEIIAAMADGAITPDEAVMLSGVFESKRKAIETSDLEARLSALEASSK